MSNKKPTKAEKVAKQATGFAAANPTLIIGGIATIGGIYLLWKLGKKIDKSSIFGDGSSIGGGGNVGSSGKKSITRNEAELIASAIYTAIAKTCLTNSCIKSMLQDALDALEPVKSMADFGLVSEAFGSPRFDGYAEAYFPFPKRNLTYWLQTKFKRDQEYYKLLQEKFPGI